MENLDPKSGMDRVVVYRLTGGRDRQEGQTKLSATGSNQPQARTNCNPRVRAVPGKAA
jgi:hypothetical protein